MKTIFRILAIVALAGTTLFAACSKEDEPVQNTAPTMPDMKYAQQESGTVVLQFLPDDNSYGFKSVNDTLKSFVYRNFVTSDTAIEIYLNVLKSIVDDEATSPWLYCQMRLKSGRMYLQSTRLGISLATQGVAISENANVKLDPFDASFPEWTDYEYNKIDINDFDPSLNTFSILVDVRMVNLYDYNVLGKSIDDCLKADMRFYAKDITYEIVGK